jgi:hypothetical protein
MGKQKKEASYLIITDVTHPFGLGVAASQLNYNIIFCLRLTPQANGFRRFAAFDND